MPEGTERLRAPQVRAGGDGGDGGGGEGGEEGEGGVAGGDGGWFISV